MTMQMYLTSIILSKRSQITVECLLYDSFHIKIKISKTNFDVKSQGSDYSWAGILTEKGTQWGNFRMLVKCHVLIQVPVTTLLSVWKFTELYSYDLHIFLHILYIIKKIIRMFVLWESLFCLKNLSLRYLTTLCEPHYFP